MSTETRNTKLAAHLRKLHKFADYFVESALHRDKPVGRLYIEELELRDILGEAANALDETVRAGEALKKAA